MFGSENDAYINRVRYVGVYFEYNVLYFRCSVLLYILNNIIIKI